MSDEYDVLGNFENLSSANIFKNIALPAVEITDPVIDGEYDISLDLEKTVSPKKKAKYDKKNDKNLENKVKLEETRLKLTAEEPELDLKKTSARRVTRSSLKNDGNESLETSAVTASTSGKRKTANKKNVNTQKSLIEDRNTSVSSIVPKNASKSTRGRRRKGMAIATTVNPPTSVETIEINDNVSDNAPTSSIFSAVQRGRKEPRDVMRARRNFIAERAARCPTVGVVDLISSPLPRIEGVIDVDGDLSNKTENQTLNKEKEPNFDVSFEEDNPEISIKINWRCKPEVFKLRKYQKFACIFEKLSSREKVQVDQIFLNLNDQIVKPNDTPASIGYKIYHFIDGRVMDSNEFGGAGATIKKKRDRNLIKLKVQSDKWKKPISMELLKTDNFRKLIIKCAEELKVPCENIKLSFDGETLQHDQTPMDVELEGGEVIEIRLKN